MIKAPATLEGEWQNFLQIAGLQGLDTMSAEYRERKKTFVMGFASCLFGISAASDLYGDDDPAAVAYLEGLKNQISAYLGVEMARWNAGDRGRL